MSERIKHSGPDTVFCVLCLSGEHERVDAEPKTLRPDYASVWPELVAYVQQAVDEDRQMDPNALGAYMRELRRKALAPTREWIDRIVRQPAGDACICTEDAWPPHCPRHGIDS